MDHDVELLRELMLSLETQQLSPRAPVVISLDEEARELGRLPEAVASGLDALLRLEYIDGAGQDEPGFWLFRKLTRKGVNFVREVRTPRDWARLKRRYAPQDAG